MAETPFFILDEKFRDSLPDNLYLNHYELAEKYIKYSAEDWRKFISKNRPFIETELAAITEAQSRSALEKLSSGKVSSADVSALRQLLEKSKIINEKLNAKQSVLISFLPNPAKPIEDRGDNLS